MTTQTVAPARTPSEQIEWAIRERSSAHHVIQVRAAIGWTVVTFGLYAFYLFYELMRRARDHNRRRVALLTAGLELAQQRALQAGAQADVGPALERAGAEVRALRALDTDYRDPQLWLLFSFLGNGLVWLVEAILLDHDLIRHARHERAAEAELAHAFTQLGLPVPVPAAAAKQPHDYVGRILALIATLGLYSLWWAADLTREGNEHVRQDEAWEDALAAAVGAAAPVPDDATLEWS